jgi:hypothetical protein
MITLPRRAVQALGAVLAVGALVPATASATPRTTAKAATDFLVGQLQGSPTRDHFVTSYEYGGSVYTYDDPGLTLDGFFAFKAAQTPATTGNYSTQATNTLNYVRDNLNSYVGTATTTAATCAMSSGDLYAGAVAKTALADIVGGRNPSTPAVTGGRNLITDLRCREATSGRFQDVATDYSVTFSQVLGILALKSYYGSTTYRNPNGSTLADAVNYLISNQCASGAFASDENSAGCTATNPADVDSTAYAVLALLQTGHTTEATSALNWLNTVKATPAVGQNAWAATYPCTTPTGSPYSVNSTALAIVANASATTPVTPLGPGEAWLVTQANATTGELAGCSSTYPAVQTSSAVRATTQGVLGLLGSHFP